MAIVLRTGFYPEIVHTRITILRSDWMRKLALEDSASEARREDIVEGSYQVSKMLVMYIQWYG